MEIKREYYKSGKLRSESPMVNGKVNGLEKVYSEKGNIVLEMYFEDDLPVGTAREYYENGQLHFSIPYVDGVKDGMVEEYDENGKLVCSTKYVLGEKAK